MRKDIDFIKQSTDKYLSKHPMSDTRDMYPDTVCQYSDKISWCAAHGNTDGIIQTIYEIYRFGYAQGAKAQTGNGSNVNAAIANKNLVEAIKALAEENKGGAC